MNTPIQPTANTSKRRTLAKILPLLAACFLLGLGPATTERMPTANRIETDQVVSNEVELMLLGEQWHKLENLISGLGSEPRVARRLSSVAGYAAVAQGRHTDADRRFLAAGGSAVAETLAWATGFATRHPEPAVPPFLSGWVFASQGECSYAVTLLVKTSVFAL